jgi:hypothetical protein
MTRNVRQVSPLLKYYETTQSHLVNGCKLTAMFSVCHYFSLIGFYKISTVVVAVSIIGFVNVIVVFGCSPVSGSKINGGTYCNIMASKIY